MTRSRPKALVTAAVRGPGLDLLHQLADLVLDSWLDQPTLRIYNADQLAERVAAEGANIVIVESDACGAELFEQPIIAVCSCRGDPTNVDVRRRHRRRRAGPAGPGRNADAVAELAVALLFAATRGVVPADHDVREGEIYRDGKIPYQRYRAWELAGKTVGLVGPRCRRARAPVAPAGPGHGRHRLRPLRRRRHELARRAARRVPTSSPCTRR